MPSPQLGIPQAAFPGKSQSILRRSPTCPAHSTIRLLDLSTIRPIDLSTTSCETTHTTLPLRCCIRARKNAECRRHTKHEVPDRGPHDVRLGLPRVEPWLEIARSREERSPVSTNQRRARPATCSYNGSSPACHRETSYSACNHRGPCNHRCSRSRPAPNRARRR